MIHLANKIQENKVLIILTLLTVIGVLIFDIFHYSKAYGIVEINNVNSLLLVPFIVLVCGLGILLGSNKQMDEFEQAFQKKITGREKDVIELVAQGKKNKEIAGELFVDISTVKSHINSIYRKTGVSNRKSLIEVAKSVLRKG